MILNYLVAAKFPLNATMYEGNKPVQAEAILVPIKQFQDKQLSLKARLLNEIIPDVVWALVLNPI